MTIFNRMEGFVGLITGWLIYPIMRIINLFIKKDIDWKEKTYTSYVKWCWRRLITGE